jgi:hypothetical protein
MHVVDKRVDWIGAGLITVGLIFVMFVVSAGSTAPNGWATGCELMRPSLPYFTAMQDLWASVIG